MKTIFLLLICIYCTNHSIAQSWSTGPDIPIPVRASNTAAYTEGDTTWIYLVSGRSLNDLMTKKVQRFNSTSLVWDTVASHPTGMLGAATAVLGDSLYCVTGVINPPGAGTSTVWKYNIKNNTWGTAASFPFGTADAKAVAYQDSLIIIAGGYSTNTYGMVYVYNAKTNSWRPGTSIPSPTGLNFGGFTISGDTLVYLCGTSGFGSTTLYNTIYIGVINQTDRSNITWTLGTNFPGATRSFFEANTWQNGIIMTGGSSNNSLSSFSNECYVYDLSTQTWNQLPDKPTQWVTGQSNSVRMPNGEWKLFCMSGYGSTGYLYEVEILSDQATDVDENEKHGLIDEFKIEAYPNPFNPSTNISVKLPAGGNVRLSIFDVLGRKVTTLIEDEKSYGSIEVTWNGKNSFSNDVASGVYYARLLVETESEMFTQTTKLVLLR